MSPHHSVLSRAFRGVQNKYNHLASEINAATNNFGNGPTEGDTLRSAVAVVASVALLTFQRAKLWNIGYGVALALIGKYSTDIKFDYRVKFSHWNSSTAQRAAIALILSSCLPVPFNQVGVSYVMGWALANVVEFVDYHFSRSDRGDAPAH